MPARTNVPPMSPVITRRKWLAKAASDVHPHLRSNEVLAQIVEAQSVQGVWSLVLFELFWVLLIMSRIAHFPGATTLWVAIPLIVANAVTTIMTRHRSIFVTNERILVFDSGFLATKSVKRLVRVVSVDRAIDIPSRRWKRFSSMGEVLYLRGATILPRANSSSVDSGTSRVIPSGVRRVDRSKGPTVPE